MIFCGILELRLHRLSGWKVEVGLSMRTYILSADFPLWDRTQPCHANKAEVREAWCVTGSHPYRYIESRADIDLRAV